MINNIFFFNTQRFKIQKKKNTLKKLTNIFPIPETQNPNTIFGWETLVSNVNIKESKNYNYRTNKKQKKNYQINLSQKTKLNCLKTYML